MSDGERIRGVLRDHIQQYFRSEAWSAAADAPAGTVPLMIPPYGAAEVWEALESLLDGQVTMGGKVARFEQDFAAYIGVRHAVMVNSGSSANLLALAVLASPEQAAPLRPGDEVITPAVTWATTVWPIIQHGLVPVLVDVDRETFNIDAAQIEGAITPRTRAILVVHLLGQPCAMDAIVEIARRRQLHLIEDACEAHGAEHRGRRVGSFGALATFSFFFSHHITTVEGGMLVTDDDALASRARAMRVFGWSRAYDSPGAISAAHPEIDPRYLFPAIGYNLRPTELQGAFGIHQLPRLDGYLDGRRANAAYWAERIESLSPHLRVQREPEAGRHAWFGYPLTVLPNDRFTRDQLARSLEARGIETRPIMAGNIAEQPALRDHVHRVHGPLTNARFVHRQALFIGNHHGVGQAERAAVVEAIAEFVRTRGANAA